MLSRYDAVMECLSAGVVIHDAASAIIDANQRARDLLGIQVLEGRLATDPAWVFLEADHSAMPLGRFPVMQVISSGEPVHDLPLIVQPPTGPELWTEVNALPVVNDVGQLEQVVVTFAQDYRSSNLANRTVKRQYWSREKGRWRIIFETVV